jgi:small subunit ribosomal protein S8
MYEVAVFAWSASWHTEGQFVGDKMTHSDPIADMLTRIRNGLVVRRDWIAAPSSKTKKAILEVFKEQGLISDFQVSQDGVKETLRIRLSYDKNNQSVISGLRKVSKPGLRIFMDKKELPRFYGGRGLTIVSTSQGVMTGQSARSKGIGGELLCHVW